MNRGNTDMTIEMPDATMPLMCLVSGEVEYNEMQGYEKEMDILRMNEHITPLGKDRHLDFRIDMYGMELGHLYFQLRSLQDGRLIEEAQIFDYARSKGVVKGSLTLKDLMKEEMSYSLCFVLEIGDGRILYYYTRVIPMENSELQAKLDYAMYFHDATFDKAKAKTELTTYLESNSEGDNSSFTYVNIHSSAEQVSWGSLNPERVGKTRARIREIDSDSAQILLDYMIKFTEGEREQYCFVQDYYRMRIGKERIYLLEYERRMEEVFDAERAVIAGNKVQLGIIDPDMEYAESADGHILAFVNCGRLFSYDATDSSLVSIFGFYGDDMEDRRETVQKNGIRIFQVDETGNVRFCVWGYMSCGTHEGSMGLAVYQYDSMLKTVEEQLFVPYSGCYDMFKRDVERLLYAGERNMYLIQDDDLYELDIAGRSANVLAQDLPDGAFIASDGSEIMAWGTGKELYDSDCIILKNVYTGASSRIEGEAGDCLLPISFFGTDLVYGVAKKSDICEDENGHTVFPMYELHIRNEIGRSLKEYKVDGVYITGVEQSGDMITLLRAQKREDGSLEAVTSDQILNNDSANSRKNVLESVVTERFETIQQLVLRKEVDMDALQMIIPRIVIYEGDRQVKIENEKSEEVFYDVFAGGKLAYRSIHLYDAVNTAWEMGGAVRDEKGCLLYRRTTLPAKNQIMAISGSVRELQEGYDEKEVLAACVDSWLSFLGIDARTLSSFASGKDAVEVIQENYPNGEVLDLSGVELDTVLYYVANEQPVLALLADGSARLIVGYNSVSIVVLDPTASEQVYKISRDEAQKLFADGGKRFISLVSTED